MGDDLEKWWLDKKKLAVANPELAILQLLTIIDEMKKIHNRLDELENDGEKK